MQKHAVGGSPQPAIDGIPLRPQFPPPRRSAGGPIPCPSRNPSRLYSALRRPPLLEVAKSTLLILSALFPIVNPLGGSPVFLALTREYPASARRILARHVATNTFVLLLASFLVCTHILNFFRFPLPLAQPPPALTIFP